MVIILWLFCISALVQLRSAGKKLVISCGDLCASGGMFMAVSGACVLACEPGWVWAHVDLVEGGVGWG